MGYGSQDNAVVAFENLSNVAFRQISPVGGRSCFVVCKGGESAVPGNHTPSSSNLPIVPNYLANPVFPYFGNNSDIGCRPVNTVTSTGSVCAVNSSRGGDDSEGWLRLSGFDFHPLITLLSSFFNNKKGKMRSRFLALQ